MFKCKKCNYQTSRKNNYDRHTISCKYNKKIADECICDFCNGKYSTQKNLNIHLKSCVQKGVKYQNEKLNMKHTIDIMRQEIDNMRQQMEEKDDRIYEKNKEINFLQRVVDSAGMIIKESMGSFRFINENLYYAQPLLLYSEFSFLDEYNTLKEKIDVLIEHYKKNMLYILIGNKIINEYVKADPRDQAVWNSDLTRLTYFNRVFTKKTEDGVNVESCEWEMDKKGIRTIKYLIDPIISHIEAMMDDFMTNFDQHFDHCNYDMSKRTDYTNAICGIRGIIMDGTLHSEILKYIGKHFYVNKVHIMETIKTLPIREEIRERIQDKIEAIECKYTSKIKSKNKPTLSTNNPTDQNKQKNKKVKSVTSNKLKITNAKSNKDKQDIYIEPNDLLSDSEEQDINLESDDLLSDEEYEQINTKVIISDDELSELEEHKNKKPQIKSNKKVKSKIVVSDDELSELEEHKNKKPQIKSNKKVKSKIVVSDDELSELEEYKNKKPQVKSNKKAKLKIVVSDDELSELEEYKNIKPKNKVKSKVVISDDELSELDEHKKYKSQIKFNNKAKPKVIISNNESSNSEEHVKKPKNKSSKKVKPIVIVSNDELIDSEEHIKKPQNKKTKKK